MTETKIISSVNVNSDPRAEKDVLWFDELHREDVALVGGKSSSLGEMTSSTNIPVPYGFATTAHAYRYFLNSTGLDKKVSELLNSIKDYENTEELHEVCSKIRKIMVETPMPEDLAENIKSSYWELSQY